MTYENLYATVTLTVDVHRGRVPASDTPDGYEPPYEYLVVRSAEVEAAKVYGGAELGILAEDEEDFDPDDHLKNAVRSALIPVPEEPQSRAVVGPCKKDVPGTVPSWAGADQIDPCRCVLDAGHEGPHRCSHTIETMPERPMTLIERIASEAALTYRDDQ